ncbi:MAG: 30S ribosomal protein S4 [Candidatus Nealsonbacteria bacterium RIFCSPLOWO2_01_FULL_43_36]|uniref:Small ribosomal subunit protein uS4 n=1 Tax=Candidatus Nealsonbacteria bacterium RIFCSPHIGHO2_02_FULL_43_13 TaxID=1801668 RepID=A0A1G2EA94_9BACT|nr:MAG: 30S ribosomal protein S4 [Candidatus Nealsonbacteria bacterium RIFCSPHIGHO2_02_FULL_43_13]OGZ25104.1 MAG: 30S ribosomal protein S4 [Candidatus Nealsonbacteria bacterium RIFCSPLOWO2_01_FULL_43_36]
MQTNTCKICRRMGTKLFLKGERCSSPKCAVIRKPYPPGPKRKGRFKQLSEYGKELQEKQKLKNWYNLRERQFAKYVKDILKRRSKVEDASGTLIQKLEYRFDNVIFRLGFASSRIQARQFVSHGHFFINGKGVNKPSYQLAKGDKVTVNPVSRKNKNIEKVASMLKKYQPPAWLKLNPENLEAEVVGVPNLIEAAPPAEISTIFEFYSR